MTLNQRAALIAAALTLASACAANARIFTETTTTAINLSGTGSQTFSFPAVANVDELVSFGGLVVNLSNNSSFQFVLDYTSGPYQLFWADPGANSIEHLGFPNGYPSDAPIPEGTINGITIEEALGGSDDSIANAQIAAGSQFVFQTAGVPEPGIWAMLVLGIAMIGLAARRRSAPAIGGA